MPGRTLGVPRPTHCVPSLWERTGCSNYYDVGVRGAVRCPWGGESAEVGSLCQAWGSGGHYAGLVSPDLKQIGKESEGIGGVGGESHTSARGQLVSRCLRTSPWLLPLPASPLPCLHPSPLQEGTQKVDSGCRHHQ